MRLQEVCDWLPVFGERLLGEPGISNQLHTPLLGATELRLPKSADRNEVAGGLRLVASVRRMVAGALWSENGFTCCTDNLLAIKCLFCDRKPVGEWYAIGRRTVANSANEDLMQTYIFVDTDTIQTLPQT